MKVTKTVAPNATPAVLDASSTGQPTSLPDMFFNSMLQANVDTTAEPDITESQETHVVTETSTADNVNTTNYSAILAQLNMISHFNNQTNSLNAATEQSNQLTNSSNSAVQSIQTIMPTLPVNTHSDIQQSPAIAPVFVNQDYQLINQATVTHTADFSDTSSPVDGEKIAAVMNDQQVSMPAATHAPEPLMDHMSQTLRKLDVPKVDSKIERTTLLPDNVTQDPVQQDLSSTHVVSAVVTDQQVNHQDLQTVPHKFVDAFTQLGNLVNTQTMAQFNHSPSTTLSAQQPVYTAQLNTQHPVNYATEIEYTTPSVTSFMKDTYDANIKIYPPELGHVTAKLRLDKNNAELMILTDNNHVKGIIEANLPKLREHFQQADINLTNIQVQTQSSSAREQAEQRQQQQQQSANNATHQQPSSLNAPSEPSKTVVKEINSLIDTYA